LLNESDLKELRAIHDNNLTPANVPSIRVPKMNPEVDFFSFGGPMLRPGIGSLLTFRKMFVPACLYWPIW